MDWLSAMTTVGAAFFPSASRTAMTDQDADDLFPQTAVTPRVEAILNGGERGKVLRQIAPRTACPDQVKQGVKDGSRIGWLASARLGSGQQWLHRRGDVA